MGRITGIGGIFFKSRDADGLRRWYGEHLGLRTEGAPVVVLRFREHDDPAREGYAVWNPFPQDTAYFDPSPAPFMINFRVEGLDDLLARLRAAGAAVDDKIESSEYGRFAWFMDPDGNRVELWEPPREG